MEYLINLILGVGLTGINNELLVLVIVSVAVFILVLATGFLFSDWLDPVRLRFLRQVNDEPHFHSKDTQLTQKLQTYSNVFIPTDKELLSRTRQRLQQAGYRKQNSVLHYYALRFFLMMVFSLLMLIVTSFLPELTSQQVILFIGISFVAGFVGPSFVLDKQIKNRQKCIQRGFPDALDLLVVCCESGLSLEAAIQRVANELEFSQPVLGEEFMLVIAEINAGVDRNKALKQLAIRTGVDSIKGLVAALAQSLRFGTSITETLRIYSDDFRDKRVQAAEEMAAKIGVKMLFPLTFFFFPEFMVIILAPTMIALLKSFSNLTG